VVALVFLASFVLKGDGCQWYSKIAAEICPGDLRLFGQNAAVRQLDSLKPADAAKARHALLGIIERSTECLRLNAESHRQLAQVQAELAADVLAFDHSPAGERVRRYELAHGARENVTNELTLAAAVGQESPTYIKTRNGTNEPTNAGDTSDGECAEVRAPTDGSEAEHFHGEIDIDQASEWIQEEIEKRKAIRADILKRLHKAIRTEKLAARPGPPGHLGGMGDADSEPMQHAVVGRRPEAAASR